jgi:carboxymethylenebutenolidase
MTDRTSRIDFLARNGEKAAGDLALPEGAAKAPAIVVLQEWWGVNDHVRSIVTRLASAGFVALAPDLYHGETVPLGDEKRASEMSQSLDGARALEEIAGAVSHLKLHPRSTGKVGIVGFCMGGALALATACDTRDVSAVVSFYGVPPSADYAKLDAPVVLHVGKRDGWVTPELAEGVKTQLLALGKSVEVFLYEADHAFFNDTRAEKYSPDAAKVAWERTLGFLRKELVAS